MTEALVTLDVTETAAVIRLNRPARHNALVPELLVDLLGFWRHRDNIADYAQQLVGLLNQVVIAICTHPSPVAYAVQGQVTGRQQSLNWLCSNASVTTEECLDMGIAHELVSTDAFAAGSDARGHRGHRKISRQENTLRTANEN